MLIKCINKIAITLERFDNVESRDKASLRILALWKVAIIIKIRFHTQKKTETALFSLETSATLQLFSGHSDLLLFSAQVALFLYNISTN